MACRVCAALEESFHRPAASLLKTSESAPLPKGDFSSGTTRKGRGVKAGE